MGLLSAIQDEQFWRDVAKNGRGLLQGASNAVASNITGPVDLINAGMGLLGMPISREPVGGEAWARKKGLTAAAPGAAGLAGETLGLVVPMVAAGKAPQIAAGMLKMADNAAAPSAANQAARNQLGAIVYHGSPHKFDRFDASKIGTGEGAQAYGHGLYLAESPDVAGSYAQSVKANTGELIKRGAAHGLPEDVASNLASALQSGKNFDPLLDSARKMIDNPLVPAPQRQAAQRLLDNEMPAYNAWSEWSKPGQVYKVDLPDNAIARMLDWDKPLSQQAPEVLQWAQRDDIRALHQMTNKGLSQATGADLYKNITATLNQKKTGELPSQMFQNNRLAGASDASDALKQLGIPGIRYLDGGSRGAGAGTSNYVVFPGEESLLKILERNGVAP